MHGGEQCEATLRLARNDPERRVPLRFKLRSFLILVVLLGAGLGTLAKLLRENPEGFVVVLRLLATVVPFVAAIATVFVVAVRGSRPQNRRLLAWGTALIVGPLLILGALTNISDPFSLVSNRALSSPRFAGQIDNPRVWNELERRARLGQLSKAEASTAIDSLATSMLAPATGRARPWSPGQPLAWAYQFLTTARNSGLVSRQAWIRLMDAYNGATGKLQNFQPIGEKKLFSILNIVYGSPFGDTLKTHWTISRVLVDGEAVDLSSLSGGNWSAYVSVKVTEPGAHTVEVELEVAYPDRNWTGAGYTQEDPALWPKALKRFKVSLKQAFTVGEPGNEQSSESSESDP